jgi:hypothetical protein
MKLTSDKLLMTFTALSDHTRRAILAKISLGETTVQELSNWISEYRQFWEASFDRLDAYLKTMVQKKKPKGKGKKNGHKK